MGRNHVSDSVEYGIDKLHRVAEQFLVYPLAAVEGAIQGAARGVHNVATHKHHLDRADAADHYGKCKCKSSKPHGSACGQHAGPSPYEFYSYTPSSAPFAPPPATAGPPQFQYHNHPAFPVPCRPPY
ncbi:hypothetical protein HRI_004896500 [Hibiscus trionum]|uniref:Uncharacterized protein n=1 Tax=Hibiscus trionum TaxID=183268 RepID=A0A9W7JCT1_HIBTR|nr:hypothetical protein HRI_004896500 [Hibiscus trionum]